MAPHGHENVRSVVRRTTAPGTILHSANPELRQPRGYRERLKARYWGLEEWKLRRPLLSTRPRAQ